MSVDVLSRAEEDALHQEELAERRRINCERQETAFRLRIEGGLSFREIAQRLGIGSRERARQLVARAEKERMT